jgi:CBS-domain-containing membrane protein
MDRHLHPLPEEVAMDSASGLGGLHVRSRKVITSGGGTVTEFTVYWAEERVHRVVVVERDGRIVGIVSSLDVLKWFSRELPSGEGVAGAVET